MRSRSFQNILLVIVFAAVIAGLTFARQWLATPTPPPTVKRIESTSTKPLVTIAGMIMPGVNYEMTPTRGHQDLWFENTHEEDVELGLDQTSCKCAGVDVTLITEKESDRIRNWLPLAAATQVAAGMDLPLMALAPALLCLNVTRDIFSDSARWQRLKREDAQPLRVAPRAQGLLRLEWEGRKMGPERISATVWTQLFGKTSSRIYTTMEMPLTFVAPLMVTPSQAKMELGPGDRQTASFWCWSATRAGFHLSAREESSHPCFSCACLPLVGQELELAQRSIKGEHGTSTKGEEGPPPILFGYHVVVTVAERLDTGLQLDLGQFDRKIILTCPDVEFQPGFHEYTVSLQGQVQGEVRVGVPGDRDKVNLGIYAKTRGTTKEVPVETLKPGLKLKLIDQIPSFLGVQLKQTRSSLEGTHYKMTVTIPRNQSYLPEDSAIILETIDNPPRKVRIPVTGIATIPIR